MKRKIIGVDIGGTYIRVGLVVNDKIVNLIKEETPKTANQIINLLIFSINKIYSTDIQGIGVGSPGSLLNGKIIKTQNLPFKNFDLKSILKRKFKKRIVVENDANCVALAESKLGSKKQNIIVLTLGTGIGGGIIINGNLYNRGGLAGELGQMYLTPNKTFEELVGSKSVSKITKKNFGKALNLTELIQLNNKNSNRILRNIAKIYGQAIGNLINIFSPELIILAPSFKDLNNKFLKLLKINTQEYIFTPFNFPIAYCKLKEPGVLGASLLVK
jgi:glucokinase